MQIPSSPPVLWADVSTEIVDTRWVLTWKFFEGRKTVKTRLVARGFQDPDLADGSVDTSSCTSMRSPHLRVILLGALKKWILWILDIKNASFQADPFHREVYLHAPLERRPLSPNRVWELNAPAYVLNGAPVAFHRSLKRYLLQHEVSLKMIGLRVTVSPWIRVFTWSSTRKMRRREFSQHTLAIF